MNKRIKRTNYSMQSYFSFIGKYKFGFFIVSLTFIIANAWLVLIPVFIGKVVGVLAVNPVDQRALTIAVSGLILCSVLHDLNWRLAEYVYLKFLLPMSYRFENLVYESVIRKPYPYFVDKFTGKISSYIGVLGDEFRKFVEETNYTYTGNLVGLIGVVVILWSINIQTAIIFIIGLIGMLIVGKLTISKNAFYEKKFMDVKSNKNGKIIDSVSNFASVKSFHKELREVSNIKQEQYKTIKAAKKSYIWSIVFWASMSFFVRFFIWISVILFNVSLFMDGKISLAQLTTLLSALLVFSNFIWEIVWHISRLNLQLARIDESYTYLFGPVNIVKQQSENMLESANRHPFKKTLGLNDISFAYPDQEDIKVLDNINLVIKKGEKIGIVGKSGSGKTTLTKLLLGYYSLPNGNITIDGEAVSTKQVSRLISFVPQDTILFHRTISENIAYASERDVSDKEVKEAARLAHAHDFIEHIKNKYDALVGERGVKLSAGQRQRIAIARAFLDDKPILILDEATSALDSESEVLIQDALEALWKNKTVIAIAHRLSTLRNMDRIIVIQDGKIIEEGTHNQLLESNGTYTSLWNHQSGGFIEE